MAEPKKNILSLLQYLASGAADARDAKIGAVGAAQVRDEYSKGNTPLASNLAKAYTKANVIGASAAGIPAAEALGAAITGTTAIPQVALATSAAPVAVMGGTAAEAVPVGLTAAGYAIPTTIYAVNKYRTRGDSQRAYGEKAADPDSPSDPNWSIETSEEEQLAARKAAAKAYRERPDVKARTRLREQFKRVLQKTQASDALYNSEGSLWKDIPTRKIGGSLKRK